MEFETKELIALYRLCEETAMKKKPRSRIDLLFQRFPNADMNRPYLFVVVGFLRADVIVGGLVFHFENCSSIKQSKIKCSLNKFFSKFKLIHIDNERRLIPNKII